MTLSLIDVQAELITILKSDISLLNLLPDPKEIREVEWIGDKFSYPNVRVRVQEFQRKDADCDIFNVLANIIISGEDASSMLTNTVASEIFNLLDKKNIHSATLNTVTRIHATQYGAVYIQEAGSWRSEVRLQFQVK